MSLQVQHAEIEDAYCTRVSMSELNARISELIWEGAKLKQLTFSEPGSALKKVIWAIHKADENMTWTVIDSSRLHVVYTAWNAEKACAEERRVILHVLDASGSKNPDRILIDGSPDSLTDWLNRCRKEKDGDGVCRACRGSASEFDFRGQSWSSAYACRWWL